MSNRLSVASSRTEILRLQETLMSRGDSLTKDEVLDLATQAAELMLQCLKLVKDKDQKQNISSKCNSLLDEAERIKSSEEWRPSDGNLLFGLASFDRAPTPPAKTLEAPISTRELTKREKIILLKGSNLNGFTFPPWDRPPGMAEFSLSEDGQQFLDTPELSLSEDQKKIFNQWKRPADALPPQLWLSAHPVSKPPVIPGPHMKETQNIDLVQDAATDCSVVASLCAGIARAERGHVKILRNVFYPYDNKAICPKLSPNGKYIVKLNFNGTSRKVEIDDRLPTTKSSRLLHVIDRNNPGLLWPALIEKAYLKVRGGYDFPGSNSGTDLWMLTGWIPEQIFLQRSETDRDALWTRVVRAFEYGDVMVTMGTGSITGEAEKVLGLAGRHDYAVLDMKELDGRRKMLIKNPWSKGMEWKNGSVELNRTFSKELASDLLIEQPHLLKEAKDELRPGTFWMALEDVMQNFETLYFNWNPGLFNHRQDIHFSWDLSPESSSGRSPAGCFATNPQHCIISDNDDRVWLLLSRHFQNEIPTFNEQPVFISLYAFDADGQRVTLSKGAFEQVPYVDSPQILLAIDVSAHKSYTIVTSEQDLPPSSHTFTLSAFSNRSISLNPAPSRFEFRQSRRGSWTTATAGGNASSLRYSENPQYSLSIEEATKISLLLQVMDTNLRIHVKIVHGRGKRVYNLTRRDILVDSGDYRGGWAFAETHTPIDAGTYTIICSTFETGQTGHFTLLVDSSSCATLMPIPSEDAGRIRTPLAVASFGAGVRVLAAPLHPLRVTPMFLTAKYVERNAVASQLGRRIGSSAPPPLRMTIELGTGPDRHILIASAGGEFSDAPTGIRTESVELSPEMRKTRDIWLVLERMGGGYSALGNVEEKVQVEMFWEGVEQVGIGVWREWQR